MKAKRVKWEEERNALHCQARGCDGCSICTKPKPRSAIAWAAVFANESLYDAARLHRIFIRRYLAKEWADLYIGTRIVRVEIREVPKRKRAKGKG